MITLCARTVGEVLTTYNTDTSSIDDATLQGQNTGSSKTVDDGAKRSARLPSLFRRSTFRNSSTTRSRPRWRGKGNAVTNQKVAGTAPLAEGGRGGSSAAGGGDGALATEEATPDWIKNLGEISGCMGGHSICLLCLERVTLSRVALWAYVM